jgi:acid phosphatase type 7
MWLHEPQTLIDRLAKHLLRVVESPAHVGVLSTSARKHEHDARFAFDGTGSSGDGELSYEWSFGDGSTGTGPTPAHTYQDDGTYTVVLTVTDAEGLVSKPDTTTAKISNIAPSVSLTLSTDAVLVGESVNASGSFTDPGVKDAPWQWELDWGDGTKQTGTASGTSATIAGSRAYTAAGTYTVRLTVTDKDGGTGTAQRTVSVSAAGPSADFTFVTDNLEVTFTDASSSPAGNITSWTWNFGDGTVGTVRNPIRTYASSGTYTVRLTVTDGTGATSSRQRTVSVSGVATSRPVLIGAGDIAGCGVDRYGIPYRDEATAAILDRFPSATVFTAGDNVYPDATWEEHIECYGPTWGRHRARTRPSPGNHEYHTPNAWAYFEYFGAAAGDPSRGYYHYFLDGWLVLALNTNIDVHAGSPQEQWLRQTLAANPRQCILAYFHHPRFSTGRGDNFHVDVTALWQALYDHRADLVISAHDHAYERFAPRRPDGPLDLERGIRQITVGTGGGRLYPWGWSPSPYTQARNNNTYGVLKLTLEANAYTWEFIPVAGSSFTDSGRGSCRSDRSPGTTAASSTTS